MAKHVPNKFLTYLLGLMDSDEAMRWRYTLKIYLVFFFFFALGKMGRDRSVMILAKLYL